MTILVVSTHGLKNWALEPRHRLFAALGAVVLLVSVGVAVWFFLLRRGAGDMAPQLDARVYQASAQALAAGSGLYDQNYLVGPDTWLPFTYPPFAAVVFLPLALVGPTTAGIIVVIVGVVALAFAIAVVARQLAAEAGEKLGRRISWLVAGLSVPVVIWLGPVESTLSYGQINLVLMALVVADLVAVKKPGIQGVLIGLAAAIKLTPAAFVLYFLLRRQWAALSMAILSGVVFTAATWWFLPNDSTQYFFGALRDASRVGDLSYSMNQSLRGMLARLIDAPWADTLWLVLVVAAVVVTVLAMRQQLRAGAVTAAIASNAVLALLISPISWGHHWVWLVVILACFVATWWTRRSRVALIGAAIVAAVMVLAPHRLVSPRGVDVNNLPLMVQIVINDHVLLGLVWILVALIAPHAASPYISGRKGREPSAKTGVASNVKGPHRTSSEER